MGRSFGIALVAIALATACDRNVEPFDPSEPVERPDLSKIFPEGAERSGDAQALRGAMPAAAGAEAPRGGAPLAGTVSIAPALAALVRPGSVLFLILRTGPGPPTAVRRFSDPSFPLEFSIGPEDRMIASMPFDGPFQLVGRVDADKDATTRNPGDLQGEAKGTYLPGASGIEIVIDQVL